MLILLCGSGVKKGDVEMDLGLIDMIGLQCVCREIVAVLERLFASECSLFCPVFSVLFSFTFTISGTDLA